MYIFYKKVLLSFFISSILALHDSLAISEFQANLSITKHLSWISEFLLNSELINLKLISRHILW